ncbi:hypothetical protein JFK97_06695 [Chromobacterium phragmitis]|uniref:hypothetical protein n=1 Tax=Chromobacterium amazonense TaxID=1382803 RepID=UPI0021B6F0D9|nr:hypothetical protein [Chromobacterium amazonense]MBM2884075.1 hypothetical protein [Chromobacterium amazonense]
MHSADPQAIRFVFRSLRGRFGNAFVDKYRSGEDKVTDPISGKLVDPGLLEAMDVWAYELRELSKADIQHGLKAKFKYPPSSDEFVQACCSREITPPTPTLTDEAQRKLAGPSMTREEAEVHIAQVAQAAKSMAMPTDNRHRLEWAYKIAREINQGVSRTNAYTRRMAAEALLNARKPVPVELVPYLPELRAEDAPTPKTNPMEDAA